MSALGGQGAALTGLDVQTRVEALARGEEVDQRIAAVASEPHRALCGSVLVLY